MKKEGDHKKHGGTYILTFDLGEKVQSLRGAGLKTPDANDTFFVEFRNELANLLQNAMPEVKVKMVEMIEMSNAIKEKALERRGLLKNAVIISSCLEIAHPPYGTIEDGFVLQINRLVDNSGKIIGIGPRPGHRDIKRQIEIIRSMSMDSTMNRPLIVMEDGAFSGKTLSYILGKFRDANLNVDAVVIGFAFPSAKENIKKDFAGEVIIINQFEKLVDWMPDHDFMPFVPNCGRVLGVSMGGVNYPFYTHEGTTFCFPYLVPFAPMSEWTTIPQSHVQKISLFCMQQAMALFDRLEKLNKTTLRVGNLVGMRPKISVPINIGQKRFPELDSSVMDFLSDTCHALA
jgi:hypothetical protein